MLAIFFFLARGAGELVVYTLAAPKYFFFSAFVTRILTPRSRKSGYGLLLGYRSSLTLDAGPFEKTSFDDDVRKMNWPKTGKFFTPVLVRHLNRSGVVELVGREPLMFAKVENGVTKSCRFFRRKNRKNAILGRNFPLF